MLFLYFRLNSGIVEEVSICEDCFNALCLDTIEDYYDFFTDYFIEKYNDDSLRIIESW